MLSSHYKFHLQLFGECRGCWSDCDSANISCLVITLCSLWMKSFLQYIGELPSCWCVMISALWPHSVTVHRFAYWSLSSSTFWRRGDPVGGCQFLRNPELFSLWYFHWNPENLPLSALRTLAALFGLHPPPHCRCCCAAKLSDDRKNVVPELFCWGTEKLFHLRCFSFNLVCTKKCC